jgi:SP family facilitated glucose transporter-like MFS transporter 8
MTKCRFSVFFPPPASISVLVCPVGLIITGVLTDRIGRKRAIQIVYIPMIISWLLLVFADSYEAILIARIIQGFPFGKFSFHKQ